MALGSPLTVPISAANMGDNTLVNGVAGSRIVVVGYVLMSSGTVNAEFYDGPSTNSLNLTGALPLIAQAGVTAPLSPLSEVSGLYWFATSSGNALILNLSGAVGCFGHLTYCLTKA